jgi:hypothetical protein
VCERRALSRAPSQRAAVSSVTSPEPTRSGEHCHEPRAKALWRTLSRAQSQGARVSTWGTLRVTLAIEYAAASEREVRAYTHARPALGVEGVGGVCAQLKSGGGSQGMCMHPQLCDLHPHVQEGSRCAPSRCAPEK